jgi:hypothetical protein
VLADILIRARHARPALAGISSLVGCTPFGACADLPVKRRHRDTAELYRSVTGDEGWDADVNDVLQFLDLARR